MTTVLIILVIITGIGGFVCYRIEANTRKFRKTMKVGDHCKVYYQQNENEHEIRTACKILKITGNMITVMVLGKKIITSKRNLYI